MQNFFLRSIKHFVFQKEDEQTNIFSDITVVEM